MNHNKVVELAGDIVDFAYDVLHYSNSEDRIRRGGTFHFRDNIHIRFTNEDNGVVIDGNKRIFDIKLFNDKIDKSKMIRSFENLVNSYPSLFIHESVHLLQKVDSYEDYNEDPVSVGRNRYEVEAIIHEIKWLGDNGRDFTEVYDPDYIRIVMSTYLNRN